MVVHVFQVTDDSLSHITDGGNAFNCFLNSVGMRFDGRDAVS